MISKIKSKIFGQYFDPKWLRNFYRFAKLSPSVMREYYRDSAVYFRYSATLGLRSRRNLIARITETFHNIEKGLSLPSPRAGFGAHAIDTLLVLSNFYIDRYGLSDRVLFSARDTLKSYRDFNVQEGHREFLHAERIDAFILRVGETADSEKHGGTRRIKKEEIQAVVAPVDEKFFLQRHSIRQFSDRPVEIVLIESAIRCALKSPAVCNRQYTKAVVIQNKSLLQRVLAAQGGSRGFSQEIGTLIAVTASVSHYWNAAERNQVWIDGGLFSMSLLLGLHSQGLGSCCLNWCKLNSQTDEMRDMLEMGKDEVIIMMIAVGHLRDEFNVAFSHRIPVAQCLRLMA